MTNPKQLSDNITITAKGIGGIDSATVSLEKGINLLKGRNATNRTSFLQAIMAVLGSDNVTLKRDRDEGYVELDMDGETFTRTLKRENGTVRFGGDPYLSETTEADLFAFLLESNEVRQAVTAKRELRDVIMRPVDTDEIERQILDLQQERKGIDDEIETLENEREKLPTLLEKRNDLTDKLKETREELAEARSALDSADGTVADRQEEQEQLEETLSELNQMRSELETVQYQLETEQEALATSREELENVRSEQEDSIDTSDQRLKEIDTEIEQLRQQKRVHDTRVSKLHRIIQFNEEMLSGEGVLGELFSEDDEGPITDKLLGDSEATCWTCGSTVAETELDGMLEQLRELSQSQRQERNQLEDKIDELIDKRDELENAQRKRETLAERVTNLEADIESREETIQELENKKAKLEDRIDELEGLAERLEGVSESRVLELHKSVNEKEVEIKRLNRELESVTEEIEELETKSDRIDELNHQREQVSEQLTEMRTRITRLEKEAIEAFNEHMESLVSLLEYENLDRVWIEHQGVEAASTSQDQNTSFVLHIVRTSEDGVTYEDRLDHLSESEREVVGIVFALAGYLVHEVYESVPFLLLDSLEAIDAERIALLIEYLADYAPAVVAALLPEDTQMLNESHVRIEKIGR